MAHCYQELWFPSWEYRQVDVRFPYTLVFGKGRRVNQPDAATAEHFKDYTQRFSV